uniref:hypothetical protein n=1 Tax=Caulobacter sp. S45 TaxID=1641861 RepID=UPI0015750787
MAEPLAHPGTAGEGLLADAAHRLDRALQVLEAAIGGGRPAASSTSLAEGVELETARRRNRELEAAAAEASHTLGRAMAQMEQALQDDEPAAAALQTSLFKPGLFEPGL